MFDHSTRFLLARLHMDSLVTKPSVKAVRKALDTLPKEVDGIYDEAMDRIERQHEDNRDLAKQILTWIVYARRSLSVEEVQHASAVTADMSDMDPEGIIDDDMLTCVCAGLVVVEEERRIIRLVREWLTFGLSAILILRRLHNTAVFRMQTTVFISKFSNNYH